MQIINRAIINYRKSKVTKHQILVLKVLIDLRIIEKHPTKPKLTAASERRHRYLEKALQCWNVQQQMYN